MKFNNMKLTPQQIERLYQFTRQHYVEWYDLQTELVDHLANAIEQQWPDNPNLDFEEVLQLEFKKFGVFGFMEVVEKRQSALNKRYNKIVWKHFKNFFSIPKVVITISLIGSLSFLFFYFQYSSILLSILFFATLVLFWIGLVKRTKAYKKEVKETGKKWLFKEIISGYSAMTGLSYLPVQIMLQFDDVTVRFSIVMSVFFASLIVTMCLLEYIILFEIPSKAQKYLEETYPEYKFVE